MNRRGTNECVAQLALVGVPDAHLLIETRRRQRSSVGAESRMRREIRVACERREFLIAVGAPHFDSAVIAGGE